MWKVFSEKRYSHKIILKLGRSIGWVGWVGSLSFTVCFGAGGPLLYSICNMIPLFIKMCVKSCFQAFYEKFSQKPYHKNLFWIDYGNTFFNKTIPTSFFMKIKKFMVFLFFHIVEVNFCNYDRRQTCQRYDRKF